MSAAGRPDAPATRACGVPLWQRITHAQLLQSEKGLYTCSASRENSIVGFSLSSQQCLAQNPGALRCARTEARI